MSFSSDRIQSLIAGLDRILDPARSRDSRPQFAELQQQRQIFSKIRNHLATQTAMLSALDSSVPEVEGNDRPTALGQGETDAGSESTGDERGDSKTEKPPPQAQNLARTLAESPQMGAVSTSSMPDTLYPTRSISS